VSLHAVPTRSRLRAGFFVSLLCLTTSLDATAAIVLGQLDGRILDRETGDGIAGALLHLQSATDPDRQLEFRSRAEGLFSIAELPAGTWQLNVAAFGYNALHRLIDIYADTTRLDLYLKAQPLLIDEVIVHARRDNNKEHTAAFVETLLLSEELGPNAPIAEVLDAATGVNIRRSGGLGSFSTVSIRGSTNEQVQIFLDGVPLNRATGGGVDIGTLPVGGIESVQIYRGAVPARFGGNSIGGVVHLRSRKTPARTKAHLHAGSGSYNTRNLSASIGGPARGWQYLVLLDHSASDNDFRFWDDNGTEYNASDDGWARRRNSDFRALRGLIKIGRPWKTGRFELHSILDQSYKGIPGIGNNQSLHTRFDTRRTITEATLFGPLAKLGAGYRIKAYRALQRDEYRDRLGEVGIGTQHSRNTTHSFGLRGELNAIGPSQSLLTGFVAARHEHFVPLDLLRAQSRFLNSRRIGVAYGAELEKSLWAGRLVFNGGTQFELLDDRLFDRTTFTRDDALSGKDNRQHLRGFRLGGRLTLGGGWHLQGHRGHYQRAPSFFELFGDKGAVIGNAGLVSESGDNWDCGLVYRRRSGARTGLVLAEVAYYDNRVENLIRFVQNSQQVSRPHNIGESALRGVETRLQARLVSLAQINSSYVYQRAENRAPYSFEYGNDLPNAPRHRLNSRIALHANHSSIFYAFSHESRHFLDRANLRSVPERTVHNLGGDSKLPYDMALSWEVGNLTNNQVADLWGYPLPGRTYSLSLRYEFAHNTPI